MSQVFSGDSVNNTASTPLTLTNETTVVTGNFLNPPFGNAKAVVVGVVNLLTGTSTSAVQLRLRRNPNAENVVVVGPLAISAGAAATIECSISAADVIPDGRAVQYALTVTQFGATGNGTVNFANVSVMLISG